jgi:hypothetical protein
LRKGRSLASAQSSPHRGLLARHATLQRPSQPLLVPLALLLVNSGAWYFAYRLSLPLCQALLLSAVAFVSQAAHDMILEPNHSIDLVFRSAAEKHDPDKTPNQDDTWAMRHRTIVEGVLVSPKTSTDRLSVIVILITSIGLTYKIRTRRSK